MVDKKFMDRELKVKMHKDLFERFTEIQNYSAVSVAQLKNAYMTILKIQADGTPSLQVVNDLVLDVLERAVDLAVLYNKDIFFVANEIYFLYVGVADSMRTGNIVVTERKIKKALAGIGIGFYEATCAEYDDAKLRVILAETNRIADAAKKLSNTFEGKSKLLRFYMWKVWQEIKAELKVMWDATFGYL